MNTKLSILVLPCALFATQLAFAQDQLQPPPPLDQTQAQPQTQTQTQQTQTAEPLQPPPPIIVVQAPPDSTTQRLDDSKKQDSGRGLEFLYVNAQGGGVFDALGTFNNSLQLVNSNVGGYMLGAEAGIRLLYVTLGLRFRYDVMSSFNLWQLNAVIGFHIPAGKWDPYISVHGGYSAIGSIDPNNLDASKFSPGTTPQDAANSFSTKGGNVGLAIGADYYFASFMSIGIEGAFEVLFLHRDPIPVPSGVPASLYADNPYYQQSGDAAGVGLVGSLHLAIHL